jgi:hypothetical protein
MCTDPLRPDLTSGAQKEQQTKPSQTESEQRRRTPLYLVIGKTVFDWFERLFIWNCSSDLLPGFTGFIIT